MNLTKLRTFLLLAEQKNFSTVADFLEISQPAVSKQLKTLELDLGVILIDRESNELTKAGQLVYKKAKSLLTAWEELVEECHYLQDELAGTLRLGASTIPSYFLIPPLLKELKSRYPRLELQLFVHDSDEILHLMRSAKLDVAIVGNRMDDDSFVHHLIARDRLSVIAPVDSEELNDVEDLLKVDFIARRGQSGTWKAAVEGLRKYGVHVEELHLVAEANSTESVISLVESGLGFSVISEFAAQPAEKNGRIRRLFELPADRNFYLIYPSVKRHSPAIEALFNLLTSMPTYLTDAYS